MICVRAVSVAMSDDVTACPKIQQELLPVSYRGSQLAVCMKHAVATTIIE